MANYDNLLSNIYYNSNVGYSGKTALLKYAKKKNKAVKRKHVDDFFARHIIPGRFSLPRRKFERRPFMVGSAGHTYGMDMAIMRNYNVKKNFNFANLLVVTDIFR